MNKSTNNEVARLRQAVASLQRVRNSTTTRSQPLASDVVIVENSSRKSYPSDGRVLLTTLSGATNYTATKISLNPGVSLGQRESNIATGYGKYKAARDWYLEFVPRKSGTYAGTVMAGIDYEAEDEAPATAVAMSTYQNFGSAPVRTSWKMPIRANLMNEGNEWKLVRCGPTATSLSYTDVCSVMLAVLGCDDTSEVLDVYIGFYTLYSARQTFATVHTPDNLLVLNVPSAQSIVKNVAEAIDFSETISAGFDYTNTAGVYTLPCGVFHVYGNVALDDSAAENSLNTIELFVDGAATSPPQYIFDTVLYITAGHKSYSFDFYVTSPSEFTVAIMVTMTGAAGTLAVAGDASRLFIEAL